MTRADERTGDRGTAEGVVIAQVELGERLVDRQPELPKNGYGPLEPFPASRSLGGEDRFELVVCRVHAEAEDVELALPQVLPIDDGVDLDAGDQLEALGHGARGQDVPAARQRVVVGQRQQADPGGGCGAEEDRRLEDPSERVEWVWRSTGEGPGGMTGSGGLPGSCRRFGYPAATCLRLDQALDPLQLERPARRRVDVDLQRVEDHGAPTSKRVGSAFMNRGSTVFGSNPITLHTGPVMPRSVRYAVPPGRIRSSPVTTCVCVPATALTRPSRYSPSAFFSEVNSQWKSTRRIGGSGSDASSSSASASVNGFSIGCM